MGNGSCGFSGLENSWVRHRWFAAEGSRDCCRWRGEERIGCYWRHGDCLSIGSPGSGLDPSSLDPLGWDNSVLDPSGLDP